MTWGRDRTIQGHWVLSVWCIEWFFTISRASQLFSTVTVAIQVQMFYTQLLYLHNFSTWVVTGDWGEFCFEMEDFRRQVANWNSCFQILHWNHHILAVKCDPVYQILKIPCINQSFPVFHAPCLNLNDQQKNARSIRFSWNSRQIVEMLLKQPDFSAGDAKGLSYLRLMIPVPYIAIHYIAMLFFDYPSSVLNWCTNFMAPKNWTRGRFQWCF